MGNKWRWAVLCPHMVPSGEEGFLLLPLQTSGMRGSWLLWQCLCSASRYSKQGSGVLSLWKLPSSILWACFADPGHATHQSQSCLKGSSSARCGATSPQVPPPLLSGLAHNCGNTDFLQMPSNDPLGIILPINKTNLENRCISYC